MSINDRARIIHNVFKQHGFSDVASAAAIGNLEHESNLQPNVTEVGGYGGYGLAQWTPKENLYTQGNALGFSRSQCEQLEVQAKIIAKATTVGQWTNAMSSNYDVAERISPLTFENYKKMTNVRSATVNFMGHYLRPTYRSADNKIYAQRIPYAEKWYEFLKNGSVPDPDPDPDPEPDPDPDPDPPKIDFSQINQFFDQFAENTQKNIINLLNKNLYDYGGSQFFGNNYLRVNENLPKTYQITVSKKFKNNFNDLFEKGKSELEKIIGNIEIPVPDPDPDPDPDPGPDPEPSKDKYFPVNKKASGINFWFPPHDSDLKKNMDWGYRTSGVWHAGYDIGGGNGGNHNIYAVRNGKVIDVRYQDLSGYLIIIQHTDDEYFTLYQHLLANSTLVKIGDTVKGGQHIAKMGASGGNYAVHLHIELAKNQNDFWTTRTLDPKPYLGVTADNTTSLKNPV